MDNGFAITVERDPQRIFEDAEYEKYARPVPPPRRSARC